MKISKLLGKLVSKRNDLITELSELDEIMAALRTAYSQYGDSSIDSDIVYLREDVGDLVEGIISGTCLYTKT